MKLGGWRPQTLLEWPAAYRLAMWAFGAAAARRELLERHVRARPGQRVLDIGCGPGDLLPLLPPVEYVGFDVSPSCIAAARRRHGDRGTFVVRGVGDPQPLPSGRFDLVIAAGVLHHLDDALARRLFAEARQVLGPGGRLVTFDGGWSADQSALARWVVARDRGQHIRSREELAALAAESFPSVAAVVRHDLLRLPYTHLILECAVDPADPADR